MKHIFLILALTVTFTGYAFGECADADKKALEAFDRAWGTAGEKGDRSFDGNLRRRLCWIARNAE